MLCLLLTNIVILQKFEIIEESGPGLVIGHIHRDFGVPVISGNNYAVILTNPINEKVYGDMIQIDEESGIIKTIKNFDREDICPRVVDCILDMQIYVFHENQPNTNSIYEAKLVVVDINDNSPYFEQKSYKIEVLENSPPGSIHPIPSAIDEDSQFGVDHYVLNESEYFRLKTGDHNRPFLVSLNPIDREQVDKICLTLTAVDKGDPPLKGSTKLIITVLDENDNKPIFPTNNYSFIISRQSFVECPINGKIYVGTVEAHDFDLNENAEIRYKIGGDIPWYYAYHFEIQERGYLFLLKSDEITQDPLLVYELRVIAENVKKSVEMRSSTHVFIHLDIARPVDSPIIVIRQIISNIVENQEHGQEVAEVAVFPPNSKSPGFASCKLDNSYFQLIFISKARQFIILSNQVFDYEKTQQVSTRITCTHKNTKSQKSISVKIINVNDNTPRFDRAVYSSNIMENNVIGRYILTVTAKDADPNDNITYSLNRTDILTIGVQSGEIYSKIVFDYETVSSYVVELYATDNWNPPLTGSALLLIKVVDSNDERPFFEKLYKFDINYLNSTVGKIKAIDRDSGQYSLIKYRITNKFYAKTFKINANGLITYNTSHFGDLPTLSELGVTACDIGMLCSTTKISIYKVMVSCESNLSQFCIPRKSVVGEYSHVFSSFIVTPWGIGVCVLAVVIMITTFVFLIKRPGMKKVVNFKNNQTKCTTIRMTSFELDNSIESVRGNGANSINSRKFMIIKSEL